MATNTKTRLLEAAIQQFSIDGFAGTSIRKLAAEVGIKESSVYKHYPSKQALFEAVLAAARSKVEALGAQSGVSVNDADAAAPVYAEISPESLVAIADGFLSMWLFDEEFIALRRVLVVEQYRSPEAGDLLRGFLIEEPLQFQTALFANLIAAGAFRPADPADVAMAFWGPVVAVLLTANEPSDADSARSRLRAHIAHFSQTHAATHAATRTAKD